MCRDQAHGGRRCPLSPAAVQANRGAQKRLYLRRQARRRIADLAAHGIPAATDLDVPVTYHYGHRLDLSRFGDIEDDASTVSCKPRGALWTAPGHPEADGSVTSEWTTYLHYEGGTVLRAESETLFDSPRTGQILDEGEDLGPIEVLGYYNRYNGDDDQIVFLRADGEEETWDLAHGAWGEQFTPGCLGPEHAAVSEDFADQWKADNGTGFVARSRRTADDALAGRGGLSDPRDLEPVRLLRAIDQAEPHDSPLYRGLFVGAAEREEFLLRVRSDGYQVGLGSFTPDHAVARDFAAGVDTQAQWRDQHDAVVIETVGPVKAVDLWPGTDEPEVVSGGKFAYVADRTEPDGTCVVTVRQVFTPTPEVPTPAAAAQTTKGLFAVTASPGAVVIRADTVGDLNAIARRYPSSNGGLSFEAMRADGIDGLSLTAGGVAATREEGAAPAVRRLSGWDVPSTVWLRPDHVVVGEFSTVAAPTGTTWAHEWFDEGAAESVGVV